MTEIIYKPTANINFSQHPHLKLGFADTFENAKLYFTELLSKRYTVIRDDQNPDYLIHGDANFGQTHFNYRNYKKKIFYTGEPVSPSYALSDHAISFDHENSPKHYRLPLYVLEFWAMNRDDDIDFYLTRDPITMGMLPRELNRDKVLAYIQSNPNCQYRNEFVEAALKEFPNGQVQCGGPHLNNIGHVIPRNRRAKIEFFEKAHFGVAMENGSKRGYVTEKLIDAYASYTVPVYWGSHTVTRDFNPKSFITVPSGQNGISETLEYMKHLLTPGGRQEYLDILHAEVFNDDIPNACVNTDLFLDWFNTFVYEG